MILFLLWQVDSRWVLIASKAHIQRINVLFCQLDMVPDVVQLQKKSTLKKQQETVIVIMISVEVLSNQYKSCVLCLISHLAHSIFYWGDVGGFW